jgi:hypothetical protein
VDYYQGVVSDFLTADPSFFVNPEFCIRLDPDGPLKKGAHWYCDIVAISARERKIYLCEVTWSQTVWALCKRLGEWAANWSSVRAAIQRDTRLDGQWGICPWVFIPREQKEIAEEKIAKALAGRSGPSAMPDPRITCLEEVVPWLYRSPHGYPLRSSACEAE